MRSWLLWASGIIAGGALVSSAACGGSDSSTAKGGGGNGGQAAGGGGSNPSMTSTGGSGGTGGAQGGGGTGGSGGTFVPMCMDSPDTILALDTLDFGASTSKTDYEHIGFDLDGFDSAGTCGGQQCTIDATYGSPTAECQDGNGGIDNSFGQQLVPFFGGLNVDVTGQANDGIKSGGFTLMLDLVGLTADADQPPLTMNLYGGGNLESKPKFDGTDCWPVTPESLSTPSDITTPKAKFPNTTIVANHVTSGIISELPLTFSTTIGQISLTIHAARVEFDLTATHDAAIKGTIGGVLDMAELQDAVQRAAYTKFMGPLCHAADNKIQGAVDILDDGTNVHGMPCQGVSVGINFSMKQVKFGGISPPTPKTKNQCKPL